MLTEALVRRTCGRWSLALRRRSMSRRRSPGGSAAVVPDRPRPGRGHALQVLGAVIVAGITVPTQLNEVPSGQTARNCTLAVGSASSVSGVSKSRVLRTSSVPCTTEPSAHCAVPPEGFGRLLEEDRLLRLCGRCGWVARANAAVRRTTMPRLSPGRLAEHGPPFLDSRLIQAPSNADRRGCRGTTGHRS